MTFINFSNCVAPGRISESEENPSKREKWFTLRSHIIYGPNKLQFAVRLVRTGTCDRLGEECVFRIPFAAASGLCASLANDNDLACMRSIHLWLDSSISNPFSGNSFSRLIGAHFFIFGCRGDCANGALHKFWQLVSGTRSTRSDRVHFIFRFNLNMIVSGYLIDLQEQSICRKCKIALNDSTNRNSHSTFRQKRIGFRESKATLDTCQNKMHLRSQSSGFWSLHHDEWTMGLSGAFAKSNKLKNCVKVRQIVELFMGI